MINFKLNTDKKNKIESSTPVKDSKGSKPKIYNRIPVNNSV